MEESPVQSSLDRRNPVADQNSSQSDFVENLPLRQLNNFPSLKSSEEQGPDRYRQMVSTNLSSPEPWLQLWNKICKSNILSRQTLHCYSEGLLIIISRLQGTRDFHIIDKVGLSQQPGFCQSWLRTYHQITFSETMFLRGPIGTSEP